MKPILFLFLVMFLSSCKNDSKENTARLESVNTIAVDYAKGFNIREFDGYKILTVENPWPEAEEIFTYLLAEDGSRIPAGLEYDQKVNIPVKRMVVTSTTHIPSLEALNEEGSLVGFPGLDYISSERTRKMINEGEVTEIGENEAINSEVLIDLAPDVVIGFAVNGNSRTFSIIERSGIPVVFNGDWTEESPLGKAEWIKFFGAFFNKSDEADEYFDKIEEEYKQAKELASSAEERPTVLSGSMFKDQWYVPYGNSWQAQFVEDANAKYVYAETEGDGSIALAFETVLNDAQNADFWVAPGQFTSYEQLMDASLHYRQFDAIKNKNIYTYSNTRGETGGVLFFELAPNRPDLVLKDLISIFHPDLLPDHQTTFFKPLD